LINDMGADDLLGGDDNSGFFGSAEDTVDLFGETPAPDITDVKQVSVTTARLPSEATTVIGSESKPQNDGYVVLARKYRPQTFDDIVGQQGVQQGLRGAIATGQISHAYLFSGPRGTGKTSTARILAKALNCQDNGPRPDPCGRCASCRSITVGSSLDVIEIDAASNTGVDNIRELKSGIVLAPFSRYKVYIVDEVHMLSNQAFNALLKTLEEPPPQVIFVLATTELHKVPETIISRCSTFMFRRFSLEELKGQLGNILDIEIAQRGLTVDPEDRERILDLVSRNAEGGMRDAQVTLDQVLVLSKQKLDFDSVRRFLGMADVESIGLFVKLMHHRNSKGILELIDTLVSQGQDLELFLKGVCEFLRDLLLVRCAGRDTALINVSEDRALELEAVANELPAAFMIGTIEQFLKVIGEMKTSGQPRTVLELAVLKLTLVEAAADIDSIIKRLDALESGHTNASQSSHSNSNPGLSRPAESVTTVSPVKLVSNADSARELSVESFNESPIGNEVDAKELQKNAVIPQANFSSGITNVEDAVQKLCVQLKEESTMLALSFEPALTGQRFDGNTLTLIINGAEKLAVSQITRPQSSAIIARIAQRVFARAINVKFEVQEGVESSLRSVSLEAVTPAKTYGPVQASQNAAQSKKSEALIQGADELDNGEQSDLKIYYPDEIREKTMVEVKASEFETLMNSDSNLRDLVEKTKEVFGIDKSRVKYHRSTLA